MYGFNRWIIGGGGEHQFVSLDATDIKEVPVETWHCRYTIIYLLLKEQNKPCTE